MDKIREWIEVLLHTFYLIFRYGVNGALNVIEREIKEMEMKENEKAA